ncbi:MAG: hypothetical protein V7K89_03725 [Nostoc sp.]|uniref:hypothetical protein n=1 Tax=Nostoc sp. TaxID=1180 RepID=UPI002FFD285D
MYHKLQLFSDRVNQKQRLKALWELLPTFKQRLNNRQQLLQEGAISGIQYYKHS